MTDDPRARLESELAAASWSDLRPHATRDRLFLVGAPVSLVDAAVAVAIDAKDEVASWIHAGSLTRPTLEQMAAWERDQGGLRFRFVIVAPFVLAEEDAETSPG